MDEPLALSEIYKDPTARYGVGSWQQLVVTRAVEASHQSGHLAIGATLASMVLVVVQIVMLDAAATAARYPPCATNLQCAAQYYCAQSGDLVSGRCRACNDSDHSVGTGGRHVAAGFNLTVFCASDQADTNACTACFDSHGKPFSLDSHAVVQGHVDAMQRGSWVSLFVAGGFVALALADHVRDNGLCQLLAGSTTEESSATTRGTLGLLWVLGQLRRFALLPMAASAYIHLVRYRGGDAMNACLSSVIVLLILHVDAALFSSRWISSSAGMRTQGRDSRSGAAQATADELRPLDVSHTVHVVLLACAIPFVVFSGHATIYPLMVFCVGGWCEVALQPGLKLSRRLVGMVGTFAKTFIGLLVLNWCDSFDRGELHL